MKNPKTVVIEVLTQDNKRVLSRHRFSAGEQQKGMRFTPAGVDQIINTFCTKFELDNPGHQYRLAELAGAKFRLVWGDHKPVKGAGLSLDLSTQVQSPVES